MKDMICQLKTAQIQMVYPLALSMLKKRQLIEEAKAKMDKIQALKA